MPLFFFVSGMFFKSYGSIKMFTIKKINTLLIPFLFFYITTSVCLPNIAHYLVGIPMVRTAEGLGWKSLYSFIWPEQYFNNPIWFIWCLFVMNFLFYVFFMFSKLFRLQELILIIVCLTCGSLGVYLGKDNFNIGGNVDTAMSAIPFFLMGYLTNNYLSHSKQNNSKIHIALMLLFFGVTYICSLYGNVNYLSNSFTMPTIFVYIGGLSGSLAVILFSKAFHTLPLITFFGRYSLIILVTHQPMIGLYKYLSSMLSIEGTIAVLFSMVLMMFSYIIIIPLLNMMIPYFTGQKNLIKV